MKLKSIFLSLAGFSLMVSCGDSGKENTPVSEFEVAPSAISAEDTSGTYEISVTGNVEWIASVEEGVAWCTIDPVSGAGSGTIVVTVAENTASELRSATIAVTPDPTSLLNVKEVTVFQTGTFVAPATAISDKIWMVGEGETLQYWSDAILLPRCDKEDFDGGDQYEPLSDCRSSLNKDVSLFSAVFVQDHHEEICPDGWRVPLFEDFQMLDINLGGIGADNQFTGATTGMIEKPMEVYNGELWGGQCYGIFHPDSVIPEYGADGFVFKKEGFYRGLRIVDAEGVPVDHGDAVLNYAEYTIDFDFGGTHSVGYGIPLRCVKTL